ncbi:MAG: L-seryl-tRNA(Sec) selenium transferase [Candidatus Ozemobacteraceae bacterium]
MKENLQEKLRLLPSVDRMLNNERLASAVEKFGSELVKFALQKTIDHSRFDILNNNVAPDTQRIIADTEKHCQAVAHPSLRAVINATGIMIHTNLGRAPLGQKIFDEMKDAVIGYSNLEFDLSSGMRGHRKTHLNSILCHVTGAEDAVVVNNNAAALVLTLNTLAKDREVIISRGELVEIGGSFRIPDILAASGARMVEVGTTNRTRVGDYEKAITPNTALLLKAHKSNYSINGFTEEPTLEELVRLAREKNIPFLFDIGSGLLRKPSHLPLAQEPDVKSALAQGIDLVTFSGDKLLGGPQSGIIAGRKDLIARLNNAPLMRAFRVGKLTIAALSSAARSYLDDATLVASLPLFAMLNSTVETLKKKAETLQGFFLRHHINSDIIGSIGRCGGGTLPELEIESFAVVLKSAEKSQRKRSEYADYLFRELLRHDHPVLAVLRKGELVFDVLTMNEEDFESVSLAVSQAVLKKGNT